MPFLNRSQIPAAIRNIYVESYRERLRQQLLDPCVTPEQRVIIKAKLDELKAPAVGATNV